MHHLELYNLESYVAELNKLKAHREVEKDGPKHSEVARDLTVPDVHNVSWRYPEQGDRTRRKLEKSSFTFEEALKRAGDYIQKGEASQRSLTEKVNRIPKLSDNKGNHHKGHFCVTG